MTISTLADIIRIRAREHGDRVALIYRDRALTYGDCDAESNRVAQALLDAGVEPHDRIAFLDKNTPEYFSLLFGGAKINAVTVAVNWRLAPREMEYILNDCEAKTLLVGEEFLGHLSQIKANLKGIKRIVVIGASGEYENFEQWVTGYPAQDPEIPSSGADVCCQLYTSGTTGLPKGVETTNDNLFANFTVASAEFGIDESTVNLVCMPLFHIAGSAWSLTGLYMAAGNVLMREVDPEEILRIIPTHGITISLFVPAVLQFMLSSPHVNQTDFSSLRAIVYGASPISNEILVKSMEKFKCDFIQVYGLTETTGAITILRPEEHQPLGPNAEWLRSAGRPWSRVSLRIVDPDSGEDLPEGRVGEVWIRSPQNMKGYWKQAEATAEAMPEGGWFRSGDAGYIKGGYLYIYDRVNDMIISGGENIYPAEVENVLMEHAQVDDVAVIGVPDEKWGETVKALVVTVEGARVSERELIEYSRERLAHYKCPTSVEWVDAIPRTPSGKILKKEIREPYWKDQERRVH